MANYANLKSTIDANVNTNGTEAITGAVLNSVLKQMVSTMGEAGYLYKGVATPATNPGTPDTNVWYLASAAGTYTNFGGSVVADGEVAILKYNGSWTKEVTGAATAAQLTQLGQETDYKIYGEKSVSKEIVWSDGVISGSTGVINSSTTYQFSQPILLKAGETIIYKTNASVLKAVVQVPNGNPVAIGTTLTGDNLIAGSANNEARYTAAEDTWIVVCVAKSQYEVSFKATTDDSVAQGVEDTQVSPFGELEITTARNLRPEPSTISNSYPDYAYIVGVKAGKSYNVRASVPSGNAIYVAFTIKYPGYAVVTSGYFSGNAGASSYVRVAPADGFLIVSCPSELSNIVIGEDTDGTIGNDVYNLKEVNPVVDDITKVSAKRPINLFNKNGALLIGKYVAERNYITAAGYYATHPIYVESGVQYKFPFLQNVFSTNYAIAICTPTGDFIYSINGTYADGFLTFTAPYDCFVRVNIGLQASVEGFMFCKADSYPETYLQYREAIGDEYHLGENQVEDVLNVVKNGGIIKTVTSVNLFDQHSTLIKHGYYSGNNFISNSGYAVTHPIAVRGGVSYTAYYNSSALGSSNTTIAVVDKDNNILSYKSGVISGYRITYTPTSDCFLSFNVSVNAKLSSMMVCETADYPNSYVGYLNYQELNEVFDSVASPLLGKSVMFAGDSICEAVGETSKDGWAARIGNKYKMVWQNKGVAGGTLTDKNLVGSAFTISSTDFGAGADYIILEGGTNDADRVGSILNGNIPAYYGSYSESGYSNNFNNQTFCGAVEYLLKRVITTYPTARVGFIIAPKMGVSQDYTKEGNNRRAYFETIIKLCKKWGVPVLNLWDECTMNPALPEHYSTDNHLFYADGQHPTAAGYDLMTPIIERWMETL